MLPIVSLQIWQAQEKHKQEKSSPSMKNTLRNILKNKLYSNLKLNFTLVLDTDNVKIAQKFKQLNFKYSC